MVLGVQNESRQEADQHEQTESTRQVVVQFICLVSFFSLLLVPPLGFLYQNYFVYKKWFDQLIDFTIRFVAIRIQTQSYDIDILRKSSF